MSQVGKRNPIKLVITKDCIANIEKNREKWRSAPLAQSEKKFQSRIEKFQELIKNPQANRTELERMRSIAGQRMRKEIQRLVESDDFIIMAQTRQAYRDGGDYALVVPSEDPALDRYELAMYVKPDEGTRRISIDGIGEAYSTLLYAEGPDDEGNYEDLS